jgi:GntR family transcriptional regulator/MocR family aminotransferase
MIPYKSLVQLNKNRSTALYLQIANSIVNLIREGVIRPGTFLPSSREMADILSVHRKTVVAAYTELSSQDWTTTVARKGIMVSKQLPELKPRSFKIPASLSAYKNGPTNFFNKINGATPHKVNRNIYRYIINDGFPDPRIAPFDALFRQYRLLFNRPFPDRQIMYGDNAGSLHFRQSLSEFLSGSRGLNIEASNLLVTRGAQMAIYIAARMLLKPGSKVIVAEPNYGMANSIFEQIGARLIKVPVDINGIDINEIKKICRKNRPDMLYVIPHHHHPTTVTLSAARRMELLSIIREFRLPVIEDDYDYDFHYARSPILPLASADHGGYVIYIGSITKTFASAVRLGYLVAPEDFVVHAAHLKKLIDIRGDVLLEESFAMLIDNGDMQKHLKKALKAYQQRRDLFCEGLKNELKGKLYFTKPAGGMSVWATFDKRYPLREVSQKVAKQGLFMSDGSTYNTGGTNYNALRMGFASLNEKEIHAVIEILKKSM